MRHIVPLALVIIHTIFVVAVARSIYMHYEGPGYQQELQMWILVAFVDFPVQMLLGVLSPFIPDWLPQTASDHIRNVIVPACIFLILGGLQWWFIGAIAAKAWNRLTSKYGSCN